MNYIRKEKGQSLTEFALVLPILLIILAGVLDLGRLYYAYMAVTDAAAEGAAYAAIYPDDPNGIFVRAQEATGGLIEIEPHLVEVTLPPTIQSGEPVVVAVSYEFTMATPFMNVVLPDGTLVLRADVTEAILTSL